MRSCCKQKTYGDLTETRTRARDYPDYLWTEEKPSHNVNRETSPFRPRSIGLYLVDRHPIRSNGGGSHGPGLSVTSTSLCPQPPGLASRSGSQEGKSRGDTKAGAPKRSRVKEQKRFGLTPVTGHLIMQDTPACRPEVVKEIAGGFGRLGEKATEVLRGLRSGPAFPVRNSMNDPRLNSHWSRALNLGYPALIRKR